MIKRSTRVITAKTKSHLLLMTYIDVNKMLMSKKEPDVKKISFRYLTGYNDNYNVRPLCIKLPQMIGYVKCFDSNKTMSFKVADKKLLKRILKYDKELIVSLVQNLIMNLFMAIMINT